jgi:hypothetical protein
VGAEEVEDGVDGAGEGLLAGEAAGNVDGLHGCELSAEILK